MSTHRDAMRYARYMHDPLFAGSLTVIGVDGNSNNFDGKVYAERQHRRKNDRGWEIVFLRDVEIVGQVAIDDTITIEGYTYSCESVSSRDSVHTRATFRRVEIGEISRNYDTR